MLRRPVPVVSFLSRFLFFFLSLSPVAIANSRRFVLVLTQFPAQDQDRPDKLGERVLSGVTTD